MEGLHANEGSVGGNHSRASSRGLRTLERERRKEQQHIQEGYHTRHDFNERSSQGEWNISYIPEQSRCSDREQELKNLQKQVKFLEIELRGRCRRRYNKDSSDDPNYTGVESSRGGSSRRSRDRSHETMGCCHESPHHDRHRHHNATLDTMSWVLRRATRSPFSDKIELTKMPRHFTHPPFTIYDGKTDLVEHVSNYIQMMLLYSQNDILMCKVFPSNLRPTTIRRFNGLRKGSIHKVPQLIDALLSIRMRSEETLQSYANKYWELYNELGRGNEQVVTNNFWLGLP